MDPPSAKKKKKTKTKDRAVFSDLNVPLEIRTELQFDKESGEFSANITNQPTTSTSDAKKVKFESPEKSTTSSTIRHRRQNKVIDGLIGQANLAYAKQKTEEALDFLREAIREDPRHPDPYLQISSIYADQGQESKSFEYRLLGAHLDSKTSGVDWAEIAEIAVSLERFEEATACYGNAVRCEPDSWQYYERRIELLEALNLVKYAMKIRLQAAQTINCAVTGMDFDLLQNLIKTAAEYYINCNDEDKAMDALKIFLLRCFEFKRTADVQHLALLKMWMERERYEDSLKSILALCPCIRAVNADGSPSMEITVTHSNYRFKPFLPDTIDRFEVGNEANSLIVGRLIICLLHMGRIQPINSLVDILLKRVINDAEEEELLLEIGRKYYSMEYYNFGMAYMERLLAIEVFVRNVDALFLCALFEQSRNNQDKELALYKRILDIQPNFVNARINLSAILQRLGQADDALEALMDCDLDLCIQLPDERLLVRQAEVLQEQGRLDEYIRCVRMILIPYFYAIYKYEEFRKRSRKRSQCNVLYGTMLTQLRDSPLEKQIKRQGVTALSENRSTDLTHENLHDYCLKLIEILHDKKRYREMLEIVCLAALEPKISNSGTQTFFNMTLFASIKAGRYSLAFEYLRYMHTHFGVKTANMESDVADAFAERLYNSMNYVLCHNQDVAYHRYIIRAETRTPGVKQLQMISGNNSLVTGSYRHALNEYLQVWDANREDPLSAFLIALTFSHIACKKDITSRHLLAMRGLAFMQIYRDLRELPQETLYNTGRLLHQLSMYSSAVHFYNQVLTKTDAPKIVKTSQKTNEIEVESAECYDLKRLAAHNLSLIYQNSGNQALALSILEKYCKI